jgi:hypothetical protein
VESFRVWKVKFDQEMALKKARDNEEKMKGLSPKEREEFKRLATRATGIITSSSLRTRSHVFLM